MSNGYNVNYNDERFTEVETDKNAALTEAEQTYQGMIDQSDKYYQAQIDASKEWEDKQSQLQQEQTDFAVEQIEQQKEQAKKDYTKEQSAAYADWQKQSNKYSANAEQMAAAGMQNTGYSESSQVSMYNTYQNRVATAKESLNQAVLDYNNAIKEARLQNNSILAEIVFEGLQQRLELSLQGFQYKNSLLLEKANKKTELESIYHSRYQDVLAQINQENALAEEIRQYNANLAEEQRQFDASLAEEQRQFNAALEAEENAAGDSSGLVIEGSEDSIGIEGDTGSTVTEYEDLPIDTSSLAALGYGPLNATALNSLITNGEVEEYIEDGMIRFRKKNNSKRSSTESLSAEVREILGWYDTQNDSPSHLPEGVRQLLGW